MNDGTRCKARRRASRGRKENRSCRQKPCQQGGHGDESKPQTEKATKHIGRSHHYRYQGCAMEGNCPPALRSRRDNRSSGLRFYLAEYSDQFLLCRDGARLVGARLVIRRLQQLMKRSLWKMRLQQR